MKWKWKAKLQNFLSFVPKGELANFVLQRYITKNLPLSSYKIREMVDVADIHICNFKKHGQVRIEDAVFYEFGAGWELLGPLVFFSLGVNQQYLVDIRRLVRAELVADIATRLNKELESRPNRRHLNSLSSKKSDCDSELKRFFGIDYRAPCDARGTGLDEKSVDYITSTNTLEHIGEDDISAIMMENRRLLKDNGLMCFLIDYQDHYSYFDSSASIYNFLQYDKKEWDKKYNPSLHYQNRLRHSDYVRFIENAGFKVISCSVSEPSTEELATLNSIKLSPEFLKYDREDLAIRGAVFVLEKG